METCSLQYTEVCTDMEPESLFVMEIEKRDVIFFFFFVKMNAKLLILNCEK